QHARAEVVLLEGCVSVVLQRCRRLGHGTGVAFDLRFELDGSFIERALLKGLVGRDRRRQDKGQERGGEAGANKAKHGSNPPGSSGSPRHFKSRWCRAHGSRRRTGGKHAAPFPKLVRSSKGSVDILRVEFSWVEKYCSKVFIF